MMKTSTIGFVGFLFHYFVYYAYAQHIICNSLTGYNTKHLVSASQWMFTSDSLCLQNNTVDCTFYVSFCQPAPGCLNEYSACQNASGSPSLTILGEVTPTVFYAHEDGTKGFYAKFPNNLVQNISNVSCVPSLTIEFDCNPDVKWLLPVGDNTANAPAPKDIDIDGCATTVYFDYDGACIPKPEKPDEGLTGGAIFLIILFTVIGFYLVVGMLYNGLYKKQTGIRLLPNATFWIGLPLFAIEGCRTSFGICRCSSTPSPATYESV